MWHKVSSETGLHDLEHDLRLQTLRGEGQFRLAMQLLRGGELDQPRAKTPPRWWPGFRATLLRPAQGKAAATIARPVLTVLRLASPRYLRRRVMAHVTQQQGRTMPATSDVALVFDTDE